MVASISIHQAQMAWQAGLPAPAGKTDFSCPLTLKTVFAAADRSLWDPSKGHQPGEWFSAPEYLALSQFNCDGVYLRSGHGRKAQMKPPLVMSVSPAEGGRVKVKVRASVDNPDDNRDREVDLFFEVRNGNKVIASAAKSSEIEEGNEKDLTVTFTLAESDLVADPMTQLQLTIKAARD
jgi:hypothetical protein